ncbi:MAG TPA: hypothetical protein PKA82_01895 [Pyrinomonadaceae bacterium]|nr:hypothetical protein [Pyrinomonadaceae bacterium]
MRVAFLFVESVLALVNTASYEPPNFGTKPVSPRSANTCRCVTLPFTAPPMVDAVGVVRLS